MEMTAQFVAKNGKQFVMSLSQREQRNVQFDFLKENHSLYPVFEAMVEQYKKIMFPSTELLEQLKKNISDTHQVIIYSCIL
jgi:splicing factor 3A subunit 1